MSGFFSTEDVINLNNAKEDVHNKFDDLRDKLAARTYNIPRGREYAFTGLIRRLDTTIRAIAARDFLSRLKNWIVSALPSLENEIAPELARHAEFHAFIFRLPMCKSGAGEGRKA